MKFLRPASKGNKFTQVMDMRPSGAIPNLIQDPNGDNGAFFSSGKPKKLKNLKRKKK